MALPIDPLLPEIAATLARERRLVLQAPPGAGKTTRVPLALTDLPGKIVMLEPRRLAARAAAERLAQSFGEAPGERVGYAMRGDSKPGTAIEVVTEGILTRMLQSDPELTGIGCLIFDEFHERSLNADLGLALCLEVQSALRPDLALLVMSATLDAGPVAALMDNAPVLTSEGRSHPVEQRYLPKPLRADARFEAEMAALITQAASETSGGILAFLPGAGEIRRVAATLDGRLPGCTLRPLYGGLPFAEQRRAIAPDPKSRKIVLATSIAETSLTIEDIRVVVDGGRARRARFDPASGMGRLVTERVSRAEATQRAGRAGRVAPGTAYHLWAKAEDGALPAMPPPEITTADLSPLALDLARWGAAAEDLAFLTAPPEPSLARAQALLADLGALAPCTGPATAARPAITPHGQTMATLPVHPRLAHMLSRAGPQAAPLAALLSADRRSVQTGSDLSTALRQRPDEPTKRETARLTRASKTLAPSAPKYDAGALAALAYPDRIAKRRPGDQPRYLLSGGKGARLIDGDPLTIHDFLVVTDLDGTGVEPRIRAALPTTEADLRTLFEDQIETIDTCHWDKRKAAVISERQTRLGALILKTQPLTTPPEDALTQALLTGLTQIGLPFTPAQRRLTQRAELARKTAPELPNLNPDHLAETTQDWLAPHLSGLKSAADLRALDLTPALDSLLSYADRQRIDAILPSHYTTPTGRKVAIDYAAGTPEIALKLQEMFGSSSHPQAAGEPIRITLLSPAGRPLQTTTDIPGFWTNSYPDVRKDMRGRYPRHPWPEDPASAQPTTRVKPRK